MSQKLAIFGTKNEYGKYRFWASVSTEITESGNRTGQYARAEIQTILSDGCKDLFLEQAKATKNPNVGMGIFDVTDCWLKAVPGKDRDIVKMFVNKMNVPMTEPEAKKPARFGRD